MNKFNVSLVALSISLSNLAAAEVEYCTYDQQQVAVGESVTVKDPFLVEEAVAHFVTNGLDESSAIKRANSSDWVVYVLECQPQYTYKAPESNDKAASMLRKGKPVLVPVDHQKEWLTKLFDDS